MGDPVAQNNLAAMLRVGDPYAEDKKLAAQWFLQSAMQGNMRAQYNLANMYRTADGIGKNSAEAMKWYTYAANQGDMYAQYALGFMYYGMAKELGSKVGDAKQALDQVAKMSDADKAKHADDLKAAKDIVDSNTPELETDRQQALEWFRRAAEQGLTKAQMALARMYENGDGGPDKGMTDALVWYMNSAEAGSPEAMRRVGLLYEGKIVDWNGKGVETNYKLAFKWLRKAAEEKDDKAAMVEIGQMYAEGNEAVKRDPDKGIKWFQHAAETGDPAGQMLVAQAYEKGAGVPQSPRDAYKWYSLALRGYKAQNDADGLASAIRARIAVRLDPAEKDNVDREVQSWQPVIHELGPVKKERPLFYDQP
jgi:TPR repeat protein